MKKTSDTEIDLPLFTALLMKFTKPGIPRCMIADLSVQETVQAVHVRSWFYKAVACLERNRQIRNTDNEQKINLFGRNVYRVDINIYREKHVHFSSAGAGAVGGHRYSACPAAEEQHRALRCGHWHAGAQAVPTANARSQSS